MSPQLFFRILRKISLKFQNDATRKLQSKAKTAQGFEIRGTQYSILILNF